MRELLEADPIVALARPELLADPYPAYRWLREKQPVFWYGPFNSWVVTRHADCMAILRNSARFAADWRRVGEERPPQASSIQTLDPPEHGPIRRLVNEALRTCGNRPVERLVAEEARALLTRLEARPSFDLVHDFVQPLALSTITKFLGVPKLDGSWFIPLVAATAAGMDAGLWPERIEPAKKAWAELACLLTRWLTEPARPGVLRYVADHMPESDADRTVVANTLGVLLQAGYSSSSMLLGLAVLTLLDGRIGFSALLGADPALAVEELIRYVTPVQAMARACVVDTELGGVTMRAGQAVTLLLGAANRDPAPFPEPDVVRLDRDPNPHLGFGRGPHSCLGSAFAVVQARTVLYLLARRYPAVRAMGSPTYRQNLTLRSLDSLEVALR